MKPDRFRHFAAIDWSGAAGERHAGIALAICPAGDAAPILVRPGHRWSRDEVLDYAEVDGKPTAITPAHINLGLAIDLQGKDGQGKDETVPAIYVPAKTGNIFVLDRREILRNGPSYTLDTVHELQAEHPAALFFLVIGLEVRRELSVGELTDRSRVAVPLVAGLTGMLLPALIFVAVNAGQPTTGVQEPLPTQAR